MAAATVVARGSALGGRPTFVGGAVTWPVVEGWPETNPGMCDKDLIKHMSMV